MKFSEFSEGLGGERGPEWKDTPGPWPRPVKVTLSPQLANKLRRYADSHEMSLDEAAESLLSHALDKPPKESQASDEARKSLRKYFQDQWGNPRA